MNRIVLSLAASLLFSCAAGCTSSDPNVQCIKRCMNQDPQPDGKMCVELCESLIERPENPQSIEGTGGAKGGET